MLEGWTWRMRILSETSHRLSGTRVAIFSLPVHRLILRPMFKPRGALLARYKALVMLIVGLALCYGESY
jgi:hypothetical protein